MKTLSRLIPAVLVLASMAHAARGQAVVVSSRSADELMASARSLVVAAVGEGDQAKPILQLLDAMQGPDMLKGLDRTKPMGAFANLPSQPGEIPGVVVLVPITSQADFLGLLERFNVPTATVEGTKGVTHSISIPGQPVMLYGRFEGGYAAFSSLPAGPPATKPAAIFAESLAPLAAKVAFDQVPPAMKQAMTANIAQQAEAQGQRKPGESDESFEGRLAGMNLVFDAFNAMLRDGKDLTLALNVDAKKGDLSLDLKARSLPGTKVAASFQSFGSKASLFRSIGGTGGSGFARMPVADSIRKLFGGIIDRARESAAKQQGDPGDVALANEIFDVAGPLLTSPEVDLGVGLFGPYPGGEGGSTYAALFGLRVADGKLFDKVVRDLAAKAIKEKPDGLEKLTVDADKSTDGKTSIHEIRVAAKSLPTERFGEPVARVAVKGDAVLVAVGAKGLESLKKALAALDPAAKPGVPQIQAQASMNAILPLTTPDAKAEAAFRDQMKAAGILQGADASRDTGMLQMLGTADSLSIRLKLDGPTLKFLAAMGVNGAR